MYFYIQKIEMNYIEVVFTCCPSNEIVTDVLSANLVEIGFESFINSESGITGYIQEQDFKEDELILLLNDFSLKAKISYSASPIIDKNWNEEWEKNYFQPLVIDEKCIIKSTFHDDSRIYDYTIFIDPKMSFGTGHHQTTELMIREILKFDFKDKSVLDMGCGTAILAILASMKGANPIEAIDIDEWAYENALENLSLNNISNVEVKIGGAEILSSQEINFDVVLANINRNILLNDIQTYSSVLNKGGSLYMSGFYTEDVSIIKNESEKRGLIFEHLNTKENWAVVKFVKI